MHAQEETTFIAAVAKEVERMAADQEMKRLVLVAPPQALGVLRAEFSRSLRAMVIGEIGKNLVHLPTDEIERRLAA